MARININPKRGIGPSMGRPAAGRRVKSSMPSSPGSYRNRSRGPGMGSKPTSRSKVTRVGGGKRTPKPRGYGY